VRFGLRQEYVAHDEVLPVLRGKVHWPSQAKRQAAQRLEFRCLFDEPSADTPPNRTLKAALLAAERMLEGAVATSDATETCGTCSSTSPTRARPAGSSRGSKPTG